MYKLLIVDDEQIEREGMAHFIQWDKYDIQLCGTAWNGADALGEDSKGCAGYSAYRYKDACYEWY